MVADMRITRLGATPLGTLEGGVATEAELGEKTHDDIVVGLIVGDEDGLHRLLRGEYLIVVHKGSY
mgnify:CR=1 FL=1